MVESLQRAANTAAPWIASGTIIAVLFAVLSLAKDYGTLITRVDAIERAIPIAQANQLKLASIDAQLAAVIDGLNDIKQSVDRDRRAYPFQDDAERRAYPFQGGPR